METEPDEPLRKPRRLDPLALDPLEIEELQAYSAELAAELSRVAAAIAGKRSHRRAADGFFKPPTLKTEN